VGAAQARAPDHLDPADEVDVEDEVRPDPDGVVDIVIDPVAIDQDEETAVVVTRAAEPPESNIGVVPVIRDVKSPHAPQDVCEGSISVFPDLVGSDDAHRCRRLALLLFELRSPVYLDSHEVLDAHIQRIWGIIFRRSFNWQCEEHDDAHDIQERSNNLRFAFLQA
jgi:hypothetical protein